MKRLNFGVNVLPVFRQLICDINELICDDPANPSKRSHRY
jgi:hypothetical protein